MTKTVKKDLNYQLEKIIPKDSQDFHTVGDQNHIAKSSSTKITLEVNAEMMKFIRDYAYWEGMSQRDTVSHILTLFFRENIPQSRPEQVIKRSEERMQRDKRYKSNR
jgi:hypothetical protein